MPAAADGQRELILAHEHDRAAEHRAEDHLVDLGRLQGVGDQHLHVVAEADDVDPLHPAQFVHDVLDAVAADADARPHTIDPLIRAGDRDLGAIARLAGHGLDLDHAVADLGDLLLEEAFDQLGPGTAQDDFDAGALLADVADGGADAFVGVVGLAGDLFALWEDGLGVGQGDGGGAAFVALDDAGDELILLLHVFVEERVAFRLADLLNHDLLGGLGGDPLGDLLRRQGDAVVDAGDGPILAIDGDHDVLFFAIVTFGGGHQGRFHGLEESLLVDVLLAVDRIDDPQDFARIHHRSISPCPGTWPLATDRPSETKTPAQTTCLTPPLSTNNTTHAHPPPIAKRAKGGPKLWQCHDLAGYGTS